MPTTPFKPITKKLASEILDKSIRTLDYWVEQGEMPAPGQIGRQCYWHPDVFYGWLDVRLKNTSTDAGIPLDDKVPTPLPETSCTAGDKAASLPVKQERNIACQSPKLIADATAKRQRKLLDNLNAP